MLVALCFHSGDQDQALRLARWTRELGGCAGHDLLLVHDSLCDAASVEAIRSELAASFTRMQQLSFVDYTRGRKWSEGGSPLAANDMFATAAKHIAAKINAPWLWLEPDVVPLKSGWLDAIEAEYAALPGNKRFLGDLVTPQSSGKDVVVHCSGVAVYPANLYDHAGEALIAGDMAWDVAAAGQIVPQMQTSELILHRWRAPAFENWAQVEERIFAVKPKCVLWHADKTSSLMPLIREHNLPTKPDDGPRPNTKRDDGPMAADGHAGGGNIACDIFEFRNGQLFKV